MNSAAVKRGMWAGVGLLGAAPFAVGAAYQAAQTRKDDRRWPGLGERVKVDGRFVHVRRMGASNPGPTVLFDSGLSAPLEMWGWVQPAVAEAAPTLCYDRAGIGWSEPNPKQRTAEQITAERDRLLEVLGVSGPLVLAGHSYGGMLLRDFARRHPERVAGVVLIDSAHPEQLERSTRQRLGMPLMRADVRNRLFWARFGLSRLRGPRNKTEIDQLGERERQITIVRLMGTRNWLTSDAEIDAWLSHVVDEVRDAALPADAPLFVLTAGETAKTDPVHEELQRELAALSSSSVHQVLPESF